MITVISIAALAFQGQIGAVGDSPHESNACGPLCLSAVATHLGRTDLFDRVFELLPPEAGPRTLGELSDASESLGFHVATVRWKRGARLAFTSPAVIRIEGEPGQDVGHFVVLLRSSERSVQVLDLPGRPVWVPIESIWQGWDGVALHVSSSPEDLPRPDVGFPSLVRWTAAILGLAALCLLIHGRSRRPRDADRVIAPGSSTSMRSMLSAVATAAAFGTVIWLGLSSWAPRSPDRPPLEYSPSQLALDASGSDQASSILGKFVLRNNTADEAIVLSMSATCGCATPRLGTNRIPPGGEVELHVEVKPIKGETRAFKIHVEFQQPRNETLSLPGVVTSK